MKRIFALLAVLYLTVIQPTCATPVQGHQQSQAIANSATTVYLDGGTGTKGTYQHVRIWTSSGSSNIYVRFDGGTPTAAVGDEVIRIDGGAAYTRDRSEGMTSFNYIGDGTTGDLSVDAY